MELVAPPAIGASFGRLTARATLVALLLTAILAVAMTPSSATSDDNARDRARPGDNELFWAVADRVARGEGYYPAMAEELRSRGYPTRSVFNWRSPLPIWLVGHLPYPWIGRATLSLLGLAMLVLGTAVVLREERPRIGRALLTALLLTGPTLVCGKRGMFISMHEPWAGTLIAISVSTVGLNWRGPAVVAGLLAPFFRVLALPYPLLCAALAWREHRYKELAVWVAGLLAWAAFFGFHWLEVTGVMPPGGRFHTHSWIQFGGLPFIIASVSANVYLLLLPPWVAALYFVAAMFGLLGWHTIGGRQVAITVSLFVLLFSVVGQPFNLYWGMLYAPLLCFGAARFPASLHDLWVAAQLSGSRSRWPSGMTEKVGSAQGPWRLVVRATGEVVVPTLILADRFWLRFAGLQFRPRLPQGAGLLLVPCGSVHTCFLSFPIDLICLDSQGRVVGVRKHLRPWRAAIAPAGTHAIIETAAGEMEFEVGQVLAAECPSGGDRVPPRSLRFLL